MKKMKYLLIFLILTAAYKTHAEEPLPDLTIENIYPEVYLHKSYQRVEGFGLVSSNGLVVVENRKAFIIDTPWSKSDTKKLASWIEEQGYELVASVSTHSHEDRTGGLQWLNSQSISTYASKLTNELLKKEGNALASNSFDNPEFWLVDGSIETFYPGGGHTIDNIVVWLPKSKILFGGCFVRSLQAKGLGNTAEATIDQWPDSVGKVLSKYPDAQIVIPGHGKPGDFSLLEHTKELAESATTVQTD